MDARVTDQAAFRLVGHATRVPLVREGLNPHIRSHIASVSESERAGLTALSDSEPAGLLEVSVDVDPDYSEGSELTHLYGVAVNAATPVPNGLDVIEVPAGTWAVFRTLGPDPATWQTLAREWFPWSPWHLRPGPEIVSAHHYDGDTTATTDVWIPIDLTR